MSDGRPVRLISFLYRKPGMSVEDFAKHWRENHSRVFTSAKYVQEKVVNYEQIHPNRLLHQGLHSSNISAEECDGIVILDFDSFDDARGLLEDKASLFGVSRTSEYNEVVVADEERFIDRSKVKFFLSNIDDGFKWSRKGK